MAVNERHNSHLLLSVRGGTDLHGDGFVFAGYFEGERIEGTALGTKIRGDVFRLVHAMIADLRYDIAGAEAGFGGWGIFDD